MAEFKRRCLYKITTPNEPNVPEIYESLWAYSIQYSSGAAPTPGRYRIRITKMSGAEFMAMMGKEVDEDSAELEHSTQAYIEKWTPTGWVHVLDWIGDPGMSPMEIEIELNEMYASFTTGEPLGKTFEADIGPRPPPRKPDKTKTPVNRRAEPHPISTDGDKEDPFEFI